MNVAHPKLCRPAAHRPQWRAYPGR